MKYRRQQLEHEALVEHPERHVLHSVGAQVQSTLQFNKIRSGTNGKVWLEKVMHNEMSFSRSECGMAAWRFLG